MIGGVCLGDYGSNGEKGTDLSNNKVEELELGD